MIMNNIFTLPNSTSGADNIIIETVAQVNSFSPLLLLFVFMVVFLGGIARQKARTGTADFPMWAVVSSLAMFIIALIMTTITGLINLGTLVIVVVITIFSGLWLFLDKRGTEV